MINVGKLAIAILENKIGDLIGSNAIREIKKPYLETELKNQIIEASKQAEKQWLNEYEDKEICGVVRQMPLADLESVQKAIQNLYNNPSISIAGQTLKVQFENVFSKDFDKDRISIAITAYLEYLRVGLISIDGLRERLNALSNIESARNSGQIVDELKGIRNLLQLLVQKKSAAPKKQSQLNNLSPIQLAHETNFYSFTRRQVEKIWEEIEQEEERWSTEPLNIDTITCTNILNGYKKTIDLLVFECERHPESLSLLALLDEAKQRYDSARQRFQILTTADSTKDYKKLLTHLVRTNLEFIQIERTRLVTIDEAILYYVNQAQDYAGNKAKEYLETAQRYLDEHTPIGAEKELDKCDFLFLLDNETKIKIERFRESQVRPAILARNKASELIKEAAGLYDIQEANKKINEAEKIDPFAPYLQEIRNAIQKRISKTAE